MGAMGYSLFPPTCGDLPPHGDPKSLRVWEQLQEIRQVTQPKVEMQWKDVLNEPVLKKEGKPEQGKPEAAVGESL